MKVALCAIARRENRYLKEWIEHYRDLGIDHIIIGDNNEVEGDEDIAQFVKDEGFEDYVTVIDKKRREDNLTPDFQIEFFNEVYRDFGDDFDWIAYFDVDEFFTVIPKFCESNIKAYISKSLKNAADFFSIDPDQLFIGYMIYTDNGNIFYEDRPVLERFTEITDQVYMGEFNNLVYTGKCILRTKRPAKFTTTMHNAFGSQGNNLITVLNGGYTWRSETFESEAFYKLDGFLKHFYSKSLEEFLERRCFDRSRFISIESFDSIVNDYFKINKKTLEKTKVVELYKKMYEADMI